MGALNNTVFITVISGVLIFVLGQLIGRFVLEPLAEWRKLRGEIAHALHFYANVYVGEGLHSAEYGEEVRQHLRDLVSQPWQRAYVIPFYRVFALFKIVPSWPHLQQTSSGLTGMSNSVFSRERDNLSRGMDKRQQDIREALRLKG